MTDAAMGLMAKRWKAIRLRRILRWLGPGLITGASDDDPSGIGTYSQAGAQLGFGIGWSMILTYPLMTAIQEISARIGRVTGHGIAGNVSRHLPLALIWPLLGLIFVANTINIAADLGAMADALATLVHGPRILYVVVFGMVSVAAQILFDYKFYVSMLKWLTLTLFAYVIALATVHVPWTKALSGLFIPRIEWSASFLTTLVAILGTTISPYLFIWQSSQEAEEQRIDRRKEPLAHDDEEARREFRRIRVDTLAGMAFSNVIGLSIILTTAATLHAHGITAIETSAQAAEALRPIAGDFAGIVFALGIIGTGMLAIPALAGATAYAVGEGRRWPVGLSRKPREAAAFYGVLAVSACLGIALNFTAIDPIKALYWSAVANGVAAAPVMAILMVLVRQPLVMGPLVVRGPLYWLGWVSTAAMGLCTLGMVASLFSTY
ncbi:divalent metal cation transporter [Bradyrhizobium sp. U87765 SZCCT0131]|uniref:NRAMP family divalent metal transporter n=2 Tax=Bradyrhizobium TaxID=374 RepID=UPI001BA73394|nr:divalent metal cation transporter [Bradyrhizobium sp. U87765 SZCCT0131]MBR1262941.1 divalent metal cation transporter [Bradyrhizobium sp. U87765 SZCCT0134]MBR1307177.1 divalent metal cation transporter [Bradyrhizobium sp. U87765 SZCCT0110]MBR1322936.1 divalent metal cation transporter [Bradyrhizobium sp. U87765 SZCCT0109]MBR1346131.1 divalent metal cation transporter [Bradyrhizobium sp. U87765 SZCCT0048]